MRHQCGALRRVDRCSVRLPLRRLAMVMPQEAAEATAAGDIAQRNQVSLPLSFSATRQQQFVVQALVRPLAMVMLDKLLAQVIHVPLTEDREVIEAFLLNALNETLHERHGVGGAVGCFADVESSLFQGRIKADWELVVPVV